ncbi:hypothetical protein HanPI659440_Chr00c01g0706481 [Helianthus annuus]|nr:hypothetical protein HanPI659440_Chr00c01g0706481 [Helianthus annuus]
MEDLKVILNNRNLRDLIPVPPKILGHITMAVAQEKCENIERSEPMNFQQKCY